jgi:hypothetical protein
MEKLGDDGAEGRISISALVVDEINHAIARNTISPYLHP